MTRATHPLRMTNLPTWTPDSWRHFPSEQRPHWLDAEDAEELHEVTKTLGGLPPLIFAGEARKLKYELARASRGEAFVLQGGDCAETFSEFSADKVKNDLKVILQMAAVLAYTSGVPTIKIGRVAGQFAKPRSNETEDIAGDTLPTYRGDMVNNAFTSLEARRHDPTNMVRAYHQSASTLNLLRGFTKGGFADLASVHEWNREFVASSKEGNRYEAIAQGIERALRFMAVCGVDSRNLHEVDFYTSHEALILNYEEALTRQDSTQNNEWYDCSAHMPWIGTRTKQIDHAHVEFLRGVANPIGCKVDSEDTTDEIVALCDRLDPNKEEGRLTLICRMGHANVSKQLPKFINAVRDSGHPVTWMCDPMHGNTFTSDGGLKTRRFEEIFEEISGYFAVHQRLGTWPGGIHLELTGENVTECLGGSDSIDDEGLHTRYDTACDPRLNAKQSLDLAFRVAELLQDFSVTK
jgi:3-deoxy-7-phosphoheptulonate synthase